MSSRLLVVFLVLAPLARAAAEPAGLAAVQALLEAKKLPEAQAALEKLAAAEPGNADLQARLGDLALRRDDPAAAVKHFEKACALDPKSGRLQRRLGDAYGRSAQKASVFSKLGLAEKCVGAYRRAVELEPANVDNRLALFEYYRQAPGLAGGGADKAAAEAAEIKKLDATRGRIAFATLYAGEKKYDQALAQFEEVLREAPDDYTALYQIGRLAALTGQYTDRGIASLRRCLELAPPSGPTVPGHAAAHWRLGQLLEKKGDVAGARAAYEASVKLDPAFTAAAEALRKLK